MRLILLSLTLVVPLLGGCASVHGADSNPKHQLPLESIMSGCYGRAADIAGDNLDRPVRPAADTQRRPLPTRSGNWRHRTRCRKAAVKNAPSHKSHHTSSKSSPISAAGALCISRPTET